MSNYKRVAVTLVSVVTGLLISLSLAAPAQAHSATAWHGYDYAVVSSGHNRITWCDRERDGHRVLAYYVTRNGRRHWTAWVGSGSCATKTTLSEIVYFAVYEEGVGYGRTVWA